jgi:hypothetical protein
MRMTLKVLAPGLLCLCACSPLTTEEAIHQSLSAYTHYGWSGGQLNGAAGDKQATFVPILSRSVTTATITLSYAWKSGLLEGTLVGTTIDGTWTQDNAQGPMGLSFDARGSFVSGWWADDSAPTSRHAAFLATNP